MTDCTHEQVPITELRALMTEWLEDYGKGSSCPAYHAIVSLIILHAEPALKALTGDQNAQIKATMAFFASMMDDFMKHQFPNIGMQLEVTSERAPKSGDVH